MTLHAASVVKPAQYHQACHTPSFMVSILTSTLRKAGCCETFQSELSMITTVRVLPLKLECSNFLLRAVTQRQMILQAGGQVQRRKIHDMSELAEFDVVVNCMGLGAKELFHDAKLFPVRYDNVLCSCARLQKPSQSALTMATSSF